MQQLKYQPENTPIIPMHYVYHKTLGKKLVNSNEYQQHLADGWQDNPTFPEPIVVSSVSLQTVQAVADSKPKEKEKETK